MNTISKLISITGLLCLSLLVILCSGSIVKAQGDGDAYKEVLTTLKNSAKDHNDPISRWRYRKSCDDRCLDPDLKGPKWSGANWGTIWNDMAGKWVYFKKEYEVPEKVAGREIAGSYAYLFIECEDDAYVYVNGKEIGTIHRNGEVPLTNNAQPGDILKITMKIKSKYDLGLFRKSYVRYSKLDVLRNRTNDFIAQLESISSFMDYIKDRDKALKLINKAASLIDIDAYMNQQDDKYFASLDKTRDVLSELAPYFNDFDIYLVGYSHIDLAWLWPWSEGEEVTKNTSNTVMQLMEEYPNFVYCQTQAHGYKWMEDDYPEVFEKIKEWYKTGRWEINGGTWSEHDSNIPGGEGFARQFLYGKRYFRDKFGKDVIVGWTPDSFGYNWNLPQFLKKSGMIGFLTQKIGWNDTTRFPYNLFWWEGPDGSRILTYFPVGGYGESVDGPTMLNQLKTVMSRHKVKEHLVIFGIGDHGGGVTRGHLERAKALESNPAYPEIHYTTSEDYFKHLHEIEQKPEYEFPVWDDELYLEYHRGTYTTQSDAKKSNRLGEILMENAEKFASVARDYGMDYPADTIFNGWYWILLNHMHDIIPGSGIRQVYEDAERDYAKSFRYGRTVLNEAMNTISSDIDTSGPGVPLVMYNPLSWKRDGIVEAPIPGLTSSAAVIGPDGKNIPCQIVENGNETNILFVARDVPAVGYAVYHIIPASENNGAPDTKLSIKSGEIENEFIKVVFDVKSGLLKSVLDKRYNNREILDQNFPSNQIQVFDDTPVSNDAWNIKLGEEKRLDRYGDAEIVENGPVRVTAKITYRVGISTFHQYVSLVEGMPFVYGRIVADWQERHNMAKLKFGFNFKNDEVWYNIPYAAISRKSVPVTLAEKAKTEHCGQKWVDYSEKDGSFGVTIVNEAKYGYDAKDNVIRMSLLRSPTSPDPLADRGSHDIKYALGPHKGDWRSGDAPKKGYEYNYPLIPLITTAHNGHHPSSLSFYSASPENVALTVVKKSEDDDNVVIRLVELEGRDGITATVNLPFAPASIEEVNLIEDKMDNGNPGSVSGKTLTVPLGRHEIKTIKLFR
ncbi:MAG TPA: glycoside hydrolase family 38 C-terminal domain-containing protein [bacterium]|nr:glycoside hydrolase family 38 C-terminal domain-containing protein [bacterium]